MKSNNSVITRHWWLHVLTGVIWVIAGFFTLFFPIQSYLGLATVFSLILLLTGVFQIIFAISNYDRFVGWAWSFAVGILDLVAGGLLLIHPEITLATLPFILGFLLLFRSVSIISSAFEAKNHKFYKWSWLLLSGIGTLFFAIMVLFFPLIGIFTILIWTGTGFLLSGFGNLYIGWKEWKIERIKK